MKISKILSVFVGCLVNMTIILSLYYLSQKLQGNETFSIMIASFIAYPFASLAKKYAYFAFRNFENG